jgi:ATP/maltotriose-dependent transcriptional regulator MalT
MTLPIDERDLCFTVEEAHEAATLLDAIPDAEAVGDLVELTRGWPAALAFALRSSAHAGDARRLAAATRDVMYRYLSEQVYDSIALDERELLQHIAYLPDIDFEVLSAAGFPNARKTLDGLRRRVTFIGVEHPERYKCHDLFIEFLRYRVETDGIGARAIQLNVANALERQDRVADAVRAYAAARSESDVLRLLVDHGLDLNDTGYSDVIVMAIAALSPETQASSAIVIALRGLQELTMGRFDKAEDLLRRALTKANEPSRIVAIATRLGAVLLNVGRDARELLCDAMAIVKGTQVEAELAALLAVAYANAGEHAEAARNVEAARLLEANVTDAATRARLWQRLGVAAMALEMPYDCVVAYAKQAISYALESNLNTTVAYTYGLLGNAALSYKEDFKTAREMASRAEQSAPSDRLVRRTAGVAYGGLAILTGDDDLLHKSLALLEAYTTSDPLRSNLVLPIRAMGLAWAGNINEACRMFAEVVRCDGFYWHCDLVFYTALTAVFYGLLDAPREARLCIDKALLDATRSVRSLAYPVHQVQRSRVLCGIAEALVGRIAFGERLIRSVEAEDVATAALRDAALRCCSSFRGRRAELDAALQTLRSANFGGMAGVLQMVFQRTARFSMDNTLTKAETTVLQALARGQSPKEIAAETGRSVHTIRTLAQHAAEKLGTSGRQQTISAARRAGLIGD